MVLMIFAIINNNDQKFNNKTIVIIINHEMQDQRDWLEMMTSYYIINDKAPLVIDHQALIIKMVCRAGIPRDRNSIATIDIIEKLLILIKQTLEIIIKTESTIF